MKSGARRQDRRSLSAQQTRSVQVAHGALYIVISADLSLYLAGREEGRVLVENQA
jgi:hypothetical protein